MSDYRRYYVEGGSYFFTIVLYHRRRLFSNVANVEYLRAALRDVRSECPFKIVAAVVLPDHMYFVWTLPPGDDKYSQRIGRMKASFTKALRGPGYVPSGVSRSRRKHRESDVWNRRFWEHTLRDEDDLKRHLDYIHYNPVKHGWTTCPHLWPYSSFSTWVKGGEYELDWGCQCSGRTPEMFDFTDIEDTVGE
ncbi:MAG TPA: transposase [Pirellulales bacterium]|nr:transposase [Pirellulales bacterium]